MTVAPLDFIHDLSFDDLPAATVTEAQRCLLDLIGVAAASLSTDLSRIIRDHAAEQFGAGGRAASIMFDGRIVSPAGAALAGGMAIDSIDAHDGHKPTKGHAGCGTLPSLLAFAEAEAGNDGRAIDGREFLTTLVLGYEMSIRAGVALHATVPDYHTSGAWVAVGAAAMGARVMGMDATRTRHALGIAEYHGPRSQMMRCIDHPTMLKDGSGWGAMAGVSAAYLARDGFTGAPAITVENTPEHWATLGEKWEICNQYFKPSPVCRWAQPAVEATRMLRDRHGLTSDMVDHIIITTFHESARLHTRHPADTEQAQYSLPHPVAAAMVRGQVGPQEILPAATIDPEIHRLAAGMVIKESAEYDAAFPAFRYSDVVIVLKSGERVESGRWEARGDPETPLTMDEIHDKYHAYADPALGVERAMGIRNAVTALSEGAPLRNLTRWLGKV